jgi:hypothetical protein
VQLGLRVVVSCGVVARARAVVRRDGGPGRWSSECIETLYRVGEEVVLDSVVGVMWRMG